MKPLLEHSNPLFGRIDLSINLIASPNARLENEVSMYLNAEISKIVNANEVFQALAKGYSKFSDILS